MASNYPNPTRTGQVPKPAGKPGGLRVLDWAGFRSAQSYTFDDGNSSQIEHYDELSALGVRMTFYLTTGWPQAMHPVWQRALEDGHELGNHGHEHLQVGTGADLDEATRFFVRRFGVTPFTMAAPYGAAGYAELARERFCMNRGVHNGLIAPNDASDPHSLHCYLPPAGADAATLNREVDSARAAGKWRIMLVHGFIGGSDDAYQPVSFDEFAANVRYCQAFGDVWIDSVANVGAYWLGQKAFELASREESDAGVTFTWELPKYFPPDKYLRVSTQGGTLLQAGRELLWDSRGYYEVALDERALTWSF